MQQKRNVLCVCALREKKLFISKLSPDHEMFLRGWPLLCHRMKRSRHRKIKMGNEESIAHPAPDFSAMARDYPLPEGPTSHATVLSTSEDTSGSPSSFVQQPTAIGSYAPCLPMLPGVLSHRAPLLRQQVSHAKETAIADSTVSLLTSGAFSGQQHHGILRTTEPSMDNASLLRSILASAHLPVRSVASHSGATVDQALSLLRPHLVPRAIASTALPSPTGIPPALLATLLIQQQTGAFNSDARASHLFDASHPVLSLAGSGTRDFSSLLRQANERLAPPDLCFASFASANAQQALLSQLSQPLRDATSYVGGVDGFDSPQDTALRQLLQRLSSQPLPAPCLRAPPTPPLSVSVEDLLQQIQNTAARNSTTGGNQGNKKN